MLRKSLKRMIINVLVEIKGCENVECVAKVNISWNSCITPEAVVLIRFLKKA